MAACDLVRVAKTPMEHIWTMLIRKVFATKILLSGKFLLFVTLDLVGTLQMSYPYQFYHHIF